MYYISRTWPIIVEPETYKQENIIKQLLNTCELAYEWRDDDTVHIIVTDPSQILFLKNRGIAVRHAMQEADTLPYDDPLLE